MEAKKKETIMTCETFDDLLNAEYGERGTAEREEFEAQAETFCLAECLKEQRRLARLTQEQLAAKIGTKKSYISKIENGTLTFSYPPSSESSMDLASGCPLVCCRLVATCT